MADTTGLQKDNFVVDEKFLTSYGTQIFGTTKNARELGGVDERWVKSNDLYDAFFAPDERKVSQLLGVARVVIPKTYAQVQRILEDVLETFFFDFEEICSVNTRNKKTLSVALDTVKTLVNYRLNGNPINFYQEVYEACLDAIKNKVGIFKIYPDIKSEKKPKADKKDPQKEAEEVITNFSPKCDCLPYEDVYFHADSTWKDYWKRLIVHRKKESRDYCRRRNFLNLDKIQAAGDATGTGDQVKQQRARSRQSPFQSDSQTIKAAQGIYLYEFWDYMPGKDGFLESGSFIMGGDASGPKVLFRKWEPNKLPLKFPGEDFVRPPILVGSAFPEAHMMYGKDFPQATEGLQKETNISRNQEREAVARWLRAPILVDRNANVDVMGLMIRRIGGVVQGDNVSGEAVRELMQQSPIPVTQPSGQRIDADYAEISSITPGQLGVPVAGDQSATEFAGLNRNANKKINMVVRNLAVTLIIPALKYILRLEQAYENDAFIELVTGQRLGWTWKKDKKGEYIGTPPSLVIQGEFELFVNLGVNKQTQISQYRMIAELGNQSNIALTQAVSLGILPPAGIKFFNPVWAFEKMAPLLGQRNTDEMFIAANPKYAPPTPGGNVPRGTPSPAAVGGGEGGPENVLTR